MQVPTTSRKISIAVAPFRIAKILQVLALLLTALSFVGTCVQWYTLANHTDIHRYVRHVVTKISVNTERSVPTFYAVGLLLLASSLCWGIGHASRLGLLSKRSEGRQWILLSIVFIGLSLDEAISIHEEMNAMRSVVYLPSTNVLRWPWIIPGTVFAATVFVWYVPLLRALPRRTARLIFAAGVIYVAGAVGMEMVNSVLLSEAHNEFTVYKTAISYHAEELLEMTGVILFIYGLLDYVEANLAIVAHSRAYAQPLPNVSSIQ